MADRRLVRVGDWLLLQYGRGVACDVQRQLVLPPRRPATVYHRRSIPEQLGHSFANDGRGLAQQSSRLSGLGPARVSLVGIGPDVLHTAGPIMARAGLGPACPAEDCGER